MIKRRFLANIVIASLLTLAIIVWYRPVGRAEAEIFEAVLSSLRLETLPQSVERRTTLSEDATDLSERADWCFRKRRPSAELVDQFPRANTIQASMPFGFSRQVRMPVSSAHGLMAAASRLLVGEDPEDCSGPNNHLQFSRAAISSDRDAALVYVEFHCALCGYEGFLLLEANAEGWDVIDECMVSVS